MKGEGSLSQVFMIHQPRVALGGSRRVIVMVMADYFLVLFIYFVGLYYLFFFVVVFGLVCRV